MNSLAAFHIPHSSCVIPQNFRGSIVLSDKELRIELLRMTDWFTDELFDISSTKVAVVRYPIRGLVLDPERFLDDDMEAMTSRGMGVIYTSTSGGKQLRHIPTQDARESLIKAFYIPHHSRLSEIIASILTETGQALVVDCHSFPSYPLPYEHDQCGDRPDICLGTDPFHTPLWLVSLASSFFARGGFSVAVNRPFSGALVPGKYYRMDARVQAIMVEINRGLYMNERTGAKKPDFVVIKEKLQTALRLLIEAIAECVMDQQVGPRNRLHSW